MKHDLNVNINLNVSGTITHQILLPAPAGMITLSDLNAFGAKLMSQLSDEIVVLKQAFNDLVQRDADEDARQAAALTALQVTIDDLKDKIAKGTVTPEDMAAIQEIADGMAKVDAEPPVVPPAA